MRRTPSTPGEARLVELAAAESRDLKDAAPWPHHLLLAMLRRAEDPVTIVLARHNFDNQALIKQIQNMFRDPGHQPPDA